MTELAKAIPLIDQFNRLLTMGWATEAECNRFIKEADLPGRTAMAASDDTGDILWYVVPDHGAPLLTQEEIEKKALNYFAQ